MLGKFMACSLVVVSSVMFSFAATQLSVTNTRCEYKTNPVGIDVLNPRMSWELVSSERGTLQTAYEVRVASSIADFSKKKLIWDSGKKNSDASIQVAYEGPALASAKRYYWQVEVWDNHGHDSGWSEPAYWEMGLQGLMDLEACRPYSIRSRIEQLNVETLVVWGRQDVSAIYESAVSAVKRMPRGRMVTYENCAHKPMLEHTDEFNKLIRNFVKGQPG